MATTDDLVDAQREMAAILHILMEYGLEYKAYQYEMFTLRDVNQLDAPLFKNLNNRVLRLRQSLERLLGDDFSLAQNQQVLGHICICDKLIDMTNGIIGESARAQTKRGDSAND